MKTKNRCTANRLLVAMMFGLAATTAQAGEGITAPGIECFPHEGRGCEVIDWKQRALDFDRLAFDAHAAGTFLPLLSWRDEPQRHFTIPSYVGKPSDGEAICCLAAVMSGALIGIEKTQDRGVNWVQSCEAWFSEMDRVTLNNVGAKNGGAAFGMRCCRACFMRSLR